MKVVLYVDVGADGNVYDMQTRQPPGWKTYYRRYRVEFEVPDAEFTPVAATAVETERNDD